jgi:hypothetical protein
VLLFLEPTIRLPAVYLCVHVAMRGLVNYATQELDRRAAGSRVVASVAVHDDGVGLQHVEAGGVQAQERQVPPRKHGGPLPRAETVQEDPAWTPLRLCRRGWQRVEDRFGCGGALALASVENRHDLAIRPPQRREAQVHPATIIQLRGAEQVRMSANNGSVRRPDTHGASRGAHGG